MASLDVLIATLDTAYWELGEAFKGLPDTDVWKRPDPRLLSIGEIASHIAYGEDVGMTGGISGSPLVNGAVEYYSNALDSPVVMDYGAEALFEEVRRVHEVAKAHVSAARYDGDDLNPHREGWTWLYTLQYMVFHVSYHTGQIYSARHLMGHETVDN